MKYLILFIIPFSLTSQELLDNSVFVAEKVIYFDSNDSSLATADKQQIIELISGVDELANYMFTVDAHTDHVGSHAFNMRLSERRKEAVVNLLMENKVPDSLIISNFYGESTLVDHRKNEEGKQKNRRVVVQLRQAKKLAKIYGILVDDNSNMRIRGEIAQRSKAYKSGIQTDGNGSFTLWVPMDEDLVLDANAIGYLSSSKRIKFSKSLIGDTIQLQMTKIKLGNKFDLEELFFLSELAIVSDRSHHSIDQLRKFMLVNSDVCIELAGARAIIIQRKLTDYGISPDRMLSKGYGNWQMKYPNASTVQQYQKNRRVEVIVRNCDLTKTAQDDEIENIDFYLKKPISRN